MKPISSSLWRRMDHLIFIKADDRDRRLTWRFMETVRSSSNGRRPRRSLTERSDHPPHLIFIGRRSRLDRDAIVVRSWHDRGSIATRSWPDHDTIVARSRRDRGYNQPRSRLLQRGIMWLIIPTSSDGDRWSNDITIVAPIEAESRPISGQSRSYNVTPRNRSHEPCKLPPRPHQSAMIFGQNFPLKTDVFLPLLFNFWSIREEIKWILRKVLSSRDPLLPRV